MAGQQSAPPLLPAPQHFLTGSQPARMTAEWLQHTAQAPAVAAPQSQFQPHEQPAAH